MAGPCITGADRKDIACAMRVLVLDVVAEQGAKLQVMRSHRFCEVILPDEQVFLIGPRRLMPETRIPVDALEQIVLWRQP